MLQHQGTRTLETPRLLLRRFTPDDAAPMFANWANDTEVCRFLSWKPHGTPAVTQATLARFIAAYENDAVYHWVMELKQLGQPIGSLSVIDASETNLRCEIGYCMGKPWWGRGLMTEAVQAMTRYLMHDIGYNRVYAHHDVQNPGSGRVMEKAGMRFEGIERQRYARDGGFSDGKLWAMIREDCE